MKTFKYQAFGLRFTSDLPIPEMAVAPSGAGSAPVVIRNAEVVKTLSKPLYSGAVYQLKPGQFRLDLEGIGRFLVSNGESIEYQPYQGCDIGALRLFLLGSCMGALLHQRRQLILHASAFGDSDSACLVVGHSGAGKSSLAASLALRGFQVYADDIASITAESWGQVVHPSLTRIKLWQETAEQLEIDIQVLEAVRKGLNKFSYPISTPRLPARIKKIVILSPQNRSNFHSQPLKDPAELWTQIRLHTYRAEYMKYLRVLPNHLTRASELLNSVPTIQLERPALCSVQRLSDEVEKIWNE